MVIQQRTKYKILLIGDSCIDEYHYGSTDRISPEAPVPVFQNKNTNFKKYYILKETMLLDHLN